jgi:hypothetical protein
MLPLVKCKKFDLDWRIKGSCQGHLKDVDVILNLPDCCAFLVKCVHETMHWF